MKLITSHDSVTCFPYPSRTWMLREYQLLVVSFASSFAVPLANVLQDPTLILPTRKHVLNGSDDL